MGSKTEKGGPVDNRKFCVMAPTEKGKDNSSRLLQLSTASWWKGNGGKREWGDT
jgi:hypothetical protein